MQSFGRTILFVCLLLVCAGSAHAAERYYRIRKKLPEFSQTNPAGGSGEIPDGGTASSPWLELGVSVVNGSNKGAFSFFIHNAPVGGTYAYTLSDVDGATDDVWAAGVVSSDVEAVFGIDAGGLADGLLSLVVELEGEGGPYAPLTATIGKDTIAPAILSLNPADDSTEVGTQAQLVMTFSENVVQGSGSVVVYNQDGSIFADVAVSAAAVEDGVVVVDPDPDFVVGNSYYVNVSAGGFRDAAGNAFAGIAGNEAWNFTVAVDAPNSCGLSPVPGTVCDDGTVYVGEPEVGDPVVFTTPCDAGMTWDAGAGVCVGTRTGYPWNDGSSSFSETNATSMEDGKFNTMKLMVSQPQPFMAAEYCDSLDAHGHDDWFLPAEAELDAMRQAMVSAGGVFGSSFASGPYWSSMESSFAQARSQDFSDSAKVDDDKSSLKNVRCARRNTAVLEMVVTTGNPDEMKIEGGISPGASVSLAVTNVGVAPSSSIAIELTNTDNFSKTEDECDGQVLAVGASCFITIEPVAVEEGEYTGVVSARADFGGVVRQTLILAADGFSAKVPGTEEPDGTIYVGILPDGSEGYVPRCDTGMAWDTALAACAGTRTNFKWGTWGKITGVANVDVGLFNTENLVLVDTGADAAKQCASNTGYGYDDWYLPAKNELNLIYQASVAAGGVLQAGFDLGGARYWSSTELGENSSYDAYYAQSQRWSDGVQESRQYKTDQLHVRCLRREGLHITVASGDPAAMNLDGYNDVGEDVVLTVTNTAGSATGAISVAITGDTVHFLKPADTCSGQSLVPGGTCSITMHPYAAADADYAGKVTVSAYMGGTERISIAGAADNFLCVDSFVPGCRREDGTIYAGVTTAGDEVYAARCDAGMAWDEATKKCTGTRLGLAWGAYTKKTGVTAADSGNLNTATLVAAYTDTAAARHCDGLSAYERDDWYLPASNELDLVYATGMAVVGRFRANFNLTGDRYWASAESLPYYDYYARAIKFSDGSVASGSTKSDSLRVRCLRREGLKISVVSGNPVAMNLNGYNDLGEDVVLTVTNTATVTSGSIAVTLAGDTLHFLKTADTCEGQSLASEATCSITLHPYAGADADYAGSITVAANPGGRDRIALAGSADNFLCSDSFVPGCKADDTTIYAGNNALGDEMYAARCDAGMAWDDATKKCTGTRINLAWGTYTKVTGITNPDTGLANTAKLVADYTDTAAAKYCSDLSVHGRDDWYMPAKNELDKLYQGSVAAAGRFRVNFNLTGDWYWSSTESGPYYQYYAARQRMSDGSKDVATKNSGMRVRCLRREGIRISVVSGDPAAMDVVGGFATSDLVLSVANNGKAATGSLSVALTGNTANFLKAADSCSGNVLAPSSACSITLRPYAANASTYAGALTVSGNPGGMDVLALSGTASGFTDPSCANAPGLPGMLMPDGSVYVGCSPDGNVPMYVARCDYGYNFVSTNPQTTDNAVACTGSRGGLVFGDPQIRFMANEYNSNRPTGYANTAGLGSALVERLTTGPGHLAADYCAGLNQHGYSDWYLPSVDELSVVYDATSSSDWFREAFDTSMMGASQYWTSNTRQRSAIPFDGGYGAMTIAFESGALTDTFSPVELPSYRARCVRKEGLVIDVVSGNPDIMNLSSPDTGSEVVLRVSNMGENATSALSVGLSGFDPTFENLTVGNDNFVITENGCAGVQLAASGYCIVKVKPYAESGGAYDGILTVSASQGGNANQHLSGSTASNFFPYTCDDAPRLMPDGSVYVGCNKNICYLDEGTICGSDTNLYAQPPEHLFVTRCDAGFVHDPGANQQTSDACTGSRTRMAWAALPTYNDRVAINYCASLNEHGRSDWYLPDSRRLTVAAQIQTAGWYHDSFDTSYASNVEGGTLYWSSTEWNVGGLYYYALANSMMGISGYVSHGMPMSYQYYVRCMRSGIP